MPDLYSAIGVLFWERRIEKRIKREERQWGADRQRERDKERERDRERQRETEKETETERQRQREREHRGVCGGCWQGVLL